MNSHKMKWARGDKYAVVAEFLKGRSGTVLDVGSRDKILKNGLGPEMTYLSADMDDKHDYKIDLERPINIPDQEFDFVVALDVLEHVENIHRAFLELARITRRELIIALPNMAALSHRWSFFWRGRLATAKYDLLAEHQGDRHRWLTEYHQMNAFITVNAERAGFRVNCVSRELDEGVIAGRALRAAARRGLISESLMTSRCIYFMERIK